MASIAPMGGFAPRGRSPSSQLASDGRSSYRIVHQAWAFMGGLRLIALISREGLHRGTNPTAPASFIQVVDRVA